MQTEKYNIYLRVAESRESPAEVNDNRKSDQYEQLWADRVDDYPRRRLLHVAWDERHIEQRTLLTLQNKYVHTEE